MDIVAFPRSRVQLLPMAQAQHLPLLMMVLVLLLSLAPSFNAQAPLASPTASPSPAPAPAPAPAFCNITQVIESAGQFSNFLQLLSDTKVGERFQSQANQTNVGITVFAPIDKAFTSNPAATLLKNITQEQKVSLCEYHALTKWYSLASLQQTEDNITNTYATYNGGGGRYTLNVTDQDGTVTIKTGWSNADIISTLYNAAPCSIFAVDQVLLPEDIFGLPSPAPAPSPSAGAPLISPSSSSSTQSSAASGPSSDRSHAPSLPSFQALLFTAILLCILKLSLH